MLVINSNDPTILIVVSASNRINLATDVNMKTSPLSETPSSSNRTSATAPSSSTFMRPGLSLSIPRHRTNESIYDDVPSNSRRQSTLKRGGNMFKTFIDQYWKGGDASYLPTPK